MTMRLPLVTSFIGLMGWSVAAQADWAEFSDWTAQSFSEDTGEDLRTECQASTGGDGAPSLTFTITDGDVGPPTAYPLVTYVETGFSNVAPRIEEGEAMTLVVDDTIEIPMSGYVDMVDDRIPTGKAAPDWGDAEKAWTALRQGHRAEVHHDDSQEVWADFSLAGSAAATLNMLDRCGLAD